MVAPQEEVSQHVGLFDAVQDGDDSLVPDVVVADVQVSQLAERHAEAQGHSSVVLHVVAGDVQSQEIGPELEPVGEELHPHAADVVVAEIEEPQRRVLFQT